MANIYAKNVIIGECLAGQDDFVLTENGWGIVTRYDCEGKLVVIYLNGGWSLLKDVVVIKVVKNRNMTIRLEYMD